MHFGRPVVPDEYRIKQRMIKRQPRIVRIHRPAKGAVVRDNFRKIMRRNRRCRKFPAGVIDKNNPLHRGQAPQHRADFFADIVAPAVVEISVAGQQDARGDLPEALYHAVGAKVGRAAGPGCADCRRAQHCGNGRAVVGQHGGNPVAGRNARLPQKRRHAGGLRAQLPAGERPGGQKLSGFYQRGVVRRAGRKQVFGVVQFAVRKKTGADKVAAVFQNALAGRSQYSGPLPQEAPEFFRVVAGELVQRQKVRNVGAEFFFGGQAKAGDLRGRDLFGGRAPDDRIVGGHRRRSASS